MQKYYFVREDFLLSSKLIILLWFFASILQLALSAIKLFIFKSDIHPLDLKNQYKIPQEQNENKEQATETVRELNIISGNHKEPVSPLRTPHMEKSVINQDITIQSQYKGKKKNNEQIEEIPKQSIIQELVNLLERFIDKHLPRLSIVILCVNQLKTSFFLTVVNLIAYLIFAVLFNELRFLDSQKYGSPCQQLIHLCMLELFISYIIFPDFNLQQ